MRKVIFAAAGLLLLGAVCAGAQSAEGAAGNAALTRRWFIGVEGAYAYNTLYTENGYRPFSHYEGGYGFSVGVPVRFVIFDWLAVQSGVQFIQKNYSLARTDDERIYHDYTNSFVDFPLVAQVSTRVGLERLRVFASAGVELGVWVGQHRAESYLTWTGVGYGDDRDKTNYQPYDEDVEWNAAKDNRFDAALVGGLGIAYNLQPCTVYIEGRYHYGLTDLQKQYQRNQAPRINDTVTIGAGVLFNADIFRIFRRGR